MRDRILSLIKFLFALLLLPVVIGVTVSFTDTLRQGDSLIATSFGWGALAYLILHILFYQPTQVFDTAKKLTEETLGFVFPLIKVAGFCVPFLTVAVFVLYVPIAKLWPEQDLFPLLASLASFTFTMHMVMTANALKGKQAGWLKENYFLQIFLIYAANLTIIAVAFSYLSDFSLAGFFERWGDVAGGIYTAVYRQLFEVQR